jgi:nucleoside-diphosphate kinase
VVKPHALASGSGGALLSALQAQFEVTAAAVVCLDRADAASFLEVYKGVVPEYAHAVEELTAGPALALELAPRGGGAESAVQLLRDAAGPADPELGRVLRPASLRARFGVDKVKNALHVTDLEGDAPLEVAFFFGARR